ncbi:MAG: putative acetyltransferase EpsM [Gammaproteobacteria bacterium]|nr:putative acetyltransferase EpsM [Gammaproteobacteria bacterium]
MAVPLVVLGASGHARVVIDAARRSSAFDLLGVIDPNVPAGTMLNGLRSLGGEEYLPEIAARIDGLAAIIAIGDNAVRARVEARVLGLVPQIRFATVVHPATVIAEDVTIADGSFIAAGVTINCGTRIGRHAVINTNASVDHDASIGDFAFVGPNAALAGGVSVGRMSLIGIGASVIQGVRIGDRATIGAGAAVIDDIGSDCLAVGVPARVVKSHANLPARPER